MAELDDSAIVECEVIARHEPEWHLEAHNKFLDSHPDLRAATAELEKQGAVFEVPPTDAYRGWAQVICHRVMPLWDIPNHFPETWVENSPPHTFAPSGDYKTRVETERLIYETASDCYGEALEWWVITKTTPRRLVLYCFEISAAPDPFEIHNAILPD